MSSIRNLVRALLFCLAALPTVVKGSSLIELGNASEVIGHLKFDSTMIHLDGSSPTDIKLSDILEADFNQAPFHLDYFPSFADLSSPSLSDWNGQDIGHITTPGNFSYASGQFTLTANQWDPPSGKDDHKDHLYFVGKTWTGDGQWTVRLENSDALAKGDVHGGLTLRDSADPSSVLATIAGWDANGIYVLDRKADQGIWGNRIDTAGYPVWLRLTRQGDCLDYETSTDGIKWGLVGESTIQFSENTLVGFFAESQQKKDDEKVLLNKVLFTPAPGQAIPKGILLRSGSFLAGYFDPLDFGNDAPVGQFSRNAKADHIPIAAAQTAAAVYHPVTREQLTEAGTQVGVILKNGDFLAGTFEAINSGGARLDSMLLSLQVYNRDDIRACTLNAVDPMPSDYEVRLVDGSRIRCSGFAESNGQLELKEVSGITVTVAPEEVAQLRVGLSRAQTLLDLPWKATSPAPNITDKAPVLTGSTSVAGTGNLASTTSSVGDTSPTAQETPSAEYWTGPNQEQIVAASSGTSIDFPLTDKFCALGLKIALSPDSPQESSVIVRVLADGKEVARAPAIKAGDPPKFMRVMLQSPKLLSLVAESNYSTSRVLYIDPVVLRKNPLTKP